MAAQLDVRKLARERCLTFECRTTWRWSNGLVADLDVGMDRLLLTYRFQFADGERDVVQGIQIHRTRCRFGGSRPWFACPRCKRRAAILYLWGWPSCRTCARMAYPSQSEDKTGRSWRRSRKIESKLGGEFPAKKPKWMRRTTYERLWEAGMREEELRDEVLVELVARMRGLL